MRKVKVAENAGFCFGVSLAADKVEAALEKNEGVRLFTLGHLIHNAVYNERLERHGVRSVKLEEVEEIAAAATEASPCRLFIRAHGIPKDVQTELTRLQKENRYFSFEDCTCPLVKKIHRIAEEHSSKDHMFILFGDETHPEVIGIMSYFDGEKYVFDSPESFFAAVENGDLCNLNNKTPIFALQTTYNLSKWKKTQKFIKKL